MQNSTTGTTVRCFGWGRGWANSRRRPLLLTVLLPLTALGWALAQPSLRYPSTLSATGYWTLGPVATVAEVEHGLAEDPAGWSGRIVRVRGRVVRDVIWQAPDSLVPQLALVDPGRTQGTQALPLTWGGPDPVLAGLRGLPLLGRLVPPAQRLREGTTALYRVRVQLYAPASRAPAGAALLDADPGSR
jgi:hypothetical protein